MKFSDNKRPPVLPLECWVKSMCHQARLPSLAMQETSAESTISKTDFWDHGKTQSLKALAVQA